MIKFRSVVRLLVLDLLRFRCQVGSVADFRPGAVAGHGQKDHQKDQEDVEEKLPIRSDQKKVACAVVNSTLCARTQCTVATQIVAGGPGLRCRPQNLTTETMEISGEGRSHKRPKTRK